MSDKKATSAPAPRPAEKLTREERLAAKLRENLRRRKAQARAVGDAAPAGRATDAHIEQDVDSGRLPKTPSES